MPIPDKVPQITRVSARALVFEQLREWIEDGTLAPGETFTESEIAERLGVSRTPVREALQMLSQIGVLQTEPSRHSRVVEADPNDAALLYPPLAALVALAVEVATPRVTEADLRAMAEANERLLEAVRRGDALAARKADDDFHGVLIERAGNPYLTSVIDLLHVHSRRLDTLYFTHVGPSHQSYEEHTEILEAVRKKEVERAAEATRRNFLRAIPLFLDETKRPDGRRSYTA